MKPMEVESLRDGYVDIVDMIFKQGKVVSPRGFKTLEIEDACFTVKDTARMLPYGTGRNPNDVGYGEALLLCAGLGSPSLLTNIAGSFRRFLDGGQLHGAYGPRVRNQLETVVTRLKSDKDSRQAIVTIWDPAYDGVDGVRDLPCTINFGFRLRNDELHMSATMRSNDVWLGLAYDGFMFCQLGWTIANVLGVKLGSYTHHAYSLHMYERNFNAAEALHYTRSSDVGNFTEPLGFGFPTAYITRYEQARDRAECIYRGVELDHMTSSELLYVNKMRQYDRLTRIENFSK